MTLNERIARDENPLLHMLGVELAHWADGEAEFRNVPRVDQLSRQGRPHGGMIATLPDATCGYAGLYAPGVACAPQAATISLAISYLAPEGEEPLRMRGRVTGSGRRVFSISGEIVGETRSALVATAQGACRRQT